MSAEPKDPITEQMDAMLKRLGKISPLSANKEVFHLPLPPFEWVEFTDCGKIAFWRQVPASRGRAVEIDVKAPFDFGRHSHPFKERFTVLRGCCLFGTGDMQFMEEGDVLTMGANSIHSLRVLKAGLALVEWPDLETEEIEITIE